MTLREQEWPYREEVAESAGEIPEIRAYQNGDEYALVDLLGVEFGREAALESWRGKLRHWPSSAQTFGSRLELEEVVEADNRFDRLWDRGVPSAMFAVVRDRSWVQWRFLSSPTCKYRVVLARRGGEAAGYCACHIAATADNTSAFLAEVIGPSGDTQVQESLIAEAIEHAGAAGSDVLAALAVPGTGLHRLLRRAGFFAGPAFAVHVVPFNPGLSMDRLREPQNWQMGGAEFDVV